MSKWSCYGVICFLSLLAGCGGGGKDRDEAPGFNPYVEAFTSGTVSRNTSVYLILNRSVDSARMRAERIERLVRIKPAVKGSFAFENSRTIVFKPSEELERDARYRVKVDLSEWFDVSGEERFFSFSFATCPLELHAEWQSLDVSEKGGGGYDLQYMLFTPDRENPETVESLVGFSEPVEAAWQHSPDGRKHELRLLNVVRDSVSGGRALSLSVKPNKWGLEEGELLSTAVPGKGEFDVYDIRTVSEPEHYIEVTFTQLLDEEQNMQGLAWINGNKSDLVNVERNRLRLYPDADNSDNVNVHLNRHIRSKGGATLPADVVRQVRANRLVPSVRFVGEGVVIPQSERLTVPFQAVYLRGVIVRVIKILEQNIGSFLQMNNLDGTDGLMRGGRLVALKTIFFDDDITKDLSEWNTYAIDLSRLIEPEPGAIYRVELSFNKDLSAYPCDGGEKKDKEEIRAQDEVKFKEESSRFDEGGWGYYYSDMGDGFDYRYQDRNDPCSNSFYYNKGIGKNVLATDLGVMAMSGDDKEMTVWVHHLQHARPEKGVRVTAYNYQHQELASGMTDGQGMVHLPLANGRPFYIVASSGRQRSYLRVESNSALSLSTFDVSGEVVQKGIKGFIYGERGVWRPGDTLHLGFMLHDGLRQLPAGHPVIMELYNPLGQMYSRNVRTDGELGVYAFDMPTDADAPTGVWRAEAHVGGVTFTKRLRIETIKPNRLKIELSLPRNSLLRGEPLDARLHAEWLQGAIARNLKYDIQGTFVSAPTRFPAYPDFCFDDPAKVFNSEESKLITGTTDADGNAVVKARLDIGNSAPGMLLGNLVTRVYEESGDFSLDVMRVQYAPYKRYVGILPPRQEQNHLNTNEEHLYRVACADYSGNAEKDVPLEVNVYKVNWHWWWEVNASRLAGFVSDTYNKPVKTFSLRTDERGLASFPLSFTDEEWGSYFIGVKDKEGNHSTGVISYFDWASISGRRDMEGTSGASMLSVKTDKAGYAPGEKMYVTFPSVEEGHAVICVMNGTRLLAVKEQNCVGNQTTVQLDVTSGMQPNAYVYVTLLQPHTTTENDLPIRMYGVVPFTVTSPESRLEPVIHTADEFKPEAAYSVSVSEKQGREMAYTLAVVDEGLLDLTHFVTPDVWGAFNAREALGVRTWDMYDYVVGAYGGRIERLFSIGGGEALNKGPKAIANRFNPVVQFAGPFRLKKGETRGHTFRMPNYNGRVRVMVIAGDGRAYGNAEKSVRVRKPVMLLGTLPRVIGVGEEMVVPATVFATEKGVGDVEVSISCSSNMEIVGAETQTLHFRDIGDQSARFRLRVKNEPGIGEVTLTATGRGDRSANRTELEIRSLRRPQTTVTPVVLQAGETWEKSMELPGAAGTNTLTLEVSGARPVNLSARLAGLSAYPHDCLEQSVSKVFPLLYIEQIVSLSREQKEKAGTAVDDVIRRLRAFQTAEGAFSYWPGGTDSHAWGTVYVSHFLLEAERKGHFVPANMKKAALNNLHRAAQLWKRVPESPVAASEEMTQAYRLYVLALGQASEMGAMNRLKESGRLQPVSRQLLAAAYIEMGRDDVARELSAHTETMAAAYTEYDQTFGSAMRDKSIALLTCLRLGNDDEVAALAREIAGCLASDEWMSTQSSAFAWIAYAAYLEKYPVEADSDFSYTCGGKGESVSTSEPVWTDRLLEKGGTSVSVGLTNGGKAALFARWVAEGTPAEGDEQAYAHGISMAVSYVGLDGRPVSVESLPQGTNFTAVVTVRNASPRAYSRLALTECFPAGWEILNTRFLNGGTADSTLVGISYQDIRDDRVYTYIDRLPAGRQLTVRINLCAVYPGRFHLPPVYCEAMYDHTVRANTAGRWVTVQ